MLVRGKKGQTGKGAILSLRVREGFSDKVTSEQNYGEKWDSAKANMGMRGNVPGGEAVKYTVGIQGEGLVGQFEENVLRMELTGLGKQPGPRGGNGEGLGCIQNEMVAEE